jgi:hypothetical protein
VLRLDDRLVAEEVRIEIRRMALIGFRDEVILPNRARFQRSFIGSGASIKRNRERERSGSIASIPSVLLIPTQSTSATRPAFSQRLSSFSFGQLAAEVATGGTSPTITAKNIRRQMLAVLASLLTGDQRQEEIDNLWICLRIGVQGKERRSSVDAIERMQEEVGQRLSEDNSPGSFTPASTALPGQSEGSNLTAIDEKKVFVEQAMRERSQTMASAISSNSSNGISAPPMRAGRSLSMGEIVPVKKKRGFLSMRRRKSKNEGTS